MFATQEGFLTFAEPSRYQQAGPGNMNRWDTTGTGVLDRLIDSVAEFFVHCPHISCARAKFYIRDEILFVVRDHSLLDPGMSNNRPHTRSSFWVRHFAGSGGKIQA